MKHINSLILFAALAGSQALHAQSEVPAERLCQFTGSSQIAITTTSGETVEGTCFLVNKDEVQVKTNQGIVSVARAQLSRVRKYELPRHHQLIHLGRFVDRGVKASARLIPTAEGPIGVIGVGGTLALAAAGLPFAAFGDLIGYTKSVEIRIK